MKSISVDQLKKMFINGANKIANNFAYINELNVFPVPDGDTGTNMKITVTSAANDIALIDTNDLSVLGKSFSRSLLMNARGNSGVIFSQIMKGFVSTFQENQKELNVEDLILSFVKAKEIAYKAVANPVEGTILTVIRCISEDLTNAGSDKFENIDSLFKFVIERGNIALDSTPELLEELKRVGVVDSGGYGLMQFLTGMSDALSKRDNKLVEKTKALADEEIKQKINMSFDEHDNEGGFGYCSEIILKIGARIDPADKEKKPFNFSKFKSDLEQMGDSLVCVQDEDLVKVHLHTFKPGEFLNYAQQYGEFLKTKFENMTEQYYERIGYKGVNLVKANPANKKKIILEDKIEIIVTCPSAKIKKILNTEYGIDYLMNTEKNGNPSIQDILLEVQKTKANKILFITDDTNIVLAANQAKEIIRDEIDFRVIKGSNIFEALIAAIEFNSSVSIDMNEKTMNNAIADSLTAMISVAIKDVDYKHISIHKNDYIGIINKKIEVADVDELIVLKSCVDLLIKKSNNPDVLMLFHGSKVSKKTLSELEKYVEKKYNLICNFSEGGQKVYTYLLSIQ